LLKRIALDSGLHEISINKQAQEALRSYDWPGNVRELSNVLERVTSYLERDVIFLCDLPPYIHRNAPISRPYRAPLRFVHHTAEKEAILSALRSASYNKARTAGLLGTHRSLLYKKMKKYNLPLQDHQEIQ
jgi:DNA-binding NtrC family response regulator